MNKLLFQYLLRLADDSLMIGHRLSEWCGHGPILEEDIAMTNIALDFIGQATNVFEYAAQIENKKRTADDIAFLRYEKEYTNTLLVEQPNGDFANTMMRQFLFDSYRKPLFEELINSSDNQLSAIAEKALKETKYHLKHSAEWIIRLGDGTQESNQRTQNALNTLWRYTDELFFENDIDQELKKQKIIPQIEPIFNQWTDTINNVFKQATIDIPQNGWQYQGGRIGRHSEHLGYILTELQYMQRTYPNMKW